MPGLSSWAMRRAMMVCGSMALSRVGNRIVHDRGGRYDVVRRDHAHRYNVVRARDDSVGGHRYHWIEVARRKRVAKVAEVVREEGLHQGEIGAQRGLHLMLTRSFYNQEKPELTELLARSCRASSTGHSMVFINSARADGSCHRRPARKQSRRWRTSPAQSAPSCATGAPSAPTCLCRPGICIRPIASGAMNMVDTQSINSFSVAICVRFGPKFVSDS